MLGPVIARNVAQSASWRWFFWACTIAQAVSTIGLVIFFPETRRSQWVHAATPSTSLEPDSPSDKDLFANSEGGATQIESQVVDPCLGLSRPSRRQYSIFQPRDRNCIATTWHHVLGPFELFVFPIVFWVAMSMGAAANALLCVNLLQSQALGTPPYNFGPSQVGFANSALAVGVLLGLGTAGPFSDWIAARATKRNGGLREAEMRLPSLIPFMIVAILGMVVLGVGWQQGWPWEAVIIFGFTCVGIVAVSIPTITITYAVDCYKLAAGQTMVVATVAKNTFGFGLSYYVNNWAAESGYLAPPMLLMSMTVGFSLIGMLVSMK